MVTSIGQQRNERGFALMIVLWTLGLLALLGTALAATGRMEVRIATNARDAMIVETAADGGVQQAIFMLQQGAWAPDGAVHVLRVGQAIVEVTAADQADKLNPNMTSVASLQALLVNLRVDPSRAALLAGAIIDWRTRSLLSMSGGTKLERYRAAGLPYSSANRLFDSMDEIGLVLGMTPSVLARLEPFVSIYQQSRLQQPTANMAGSVGPDDSDHTSARSGLAGRDLVAAINAISVVRGGARFTRRVVVRFKGQSQPQPYPFQILTWDD